MSRSDNKLSIRTRGLDLDLEGDAAEVRRAYRAVRTQLIEQFFQTMQSRRGPSDQTFELATVNGEPSELSEVSEVDDDENFINVVVCEDIYNKMYLLDAERFADSFLSKILRGRHLRRIYVDHSVEQKVRDHVNVGTTLWRELTAAGKAAVGRSD